MAASASPAVLLAQVPGRAPFPSVLAGQAVQHVVRAGTWFGSYPNDGSAFSFVGCTVAPGFEFEDFELASRQILTARFPAHAEEIARLTEGLP